MRWVGKRAFAAYRASISRGVCSAKVLKSVDMKPFVPPTLLIRVVRFRSWISDSRSLMGFAGSREASAIQMRNEEEG